MARFYSGKHGKSGSKKPMTDKPQEWVRYSPEEVELLVVKLHKEGNLSSIIGKILRDSYGVSNVRMTTGKRVNEILKSRGIEIKLPDDLKSLMLRASNLREHIEKNGNDNSAIRGLMLTESKLKKLVKFYKRGKVLPDDWEYDYKKLKVMLG